MAESLQLRVIAEGIEQSAQADMLRAGGCQEAQGYYFGKPMPAEGVEKMLRAGAAR
jgi:EAL domain-containing protein (putative c-di-GMP-specific phosphodiesterase class I)